jgi:hypothetical protein
VHSFVRRSKNKDVEQDVQLEIVPEQVLQFDEQGVQEEVVELSIDSPDGQELTQLVPYRRYTEGVVIQDVQVYSFPLHVFQKAVEESQLLHVLVESSPYVPSGHVPTQLVPLKYLYPVLPQAVQISLLVWSQANH